MDKLGWIGEVVDKCWGGGWWWLVPDPVLLWSVVAGSGGRPWLVAGGWWLVPAVAVPVFAGAMWAQARIRIAPLFVAGGKGRKARAARSAECVLPPVFIHGVSRGHKRARGRADFRDMKKTLNQNPAVRQKKRRSIIASSHGKKTPQKSLVRRHQRQQHNKESEVSLNFTFCRSPSLKPPYASAPW